MKAALVFSILALASLSHADRLITVPISPKVPLHAAKFEFLRTDASDRTIGWVGYGVTRSLEIEYALVRQSGFRSIDTANLSYQLVPAITDTAPGISFGLRDLSNQTETGRVGFMVITYKASNDGELNQDIPSEISVGFWTAKQGVMFFGARLPFSESVHIVAEHDGLDLNAGLELKPIKNLGAKFLTTPRGLTWGLSYLQRF